MIPGCDMAGRGFDSLLLYNDNEDKNREVTMAEAQKVKRALPGVLVQQIKMLQKQAGLSEEDYRALLWGYGVESCRDLLPLEAHAVIKFLRPLAVVPKKSRVARSLKYEELGFRAGMATPKQLRMLEALWKEVSVQSCAKKRADAWLVFLKNRFGRITPEHIERELVGKIVRVLQVMQEAQLNRTV